MVRGGDTFRWGRVVKLDDVIDFIKNVRDTNIVSDTEAPVIDHIIQQLNRIKRV